MLPELCFEFCEARPLAGVVRPAFGHQAVKRGGTLGGHRQPLAVLYPANHIIVLHALKGLNAIHQYFPHTHTYGGNQTGGYIWGGNKQINNKMN